MTHPRPFRIGPFALALVLAVQARGDEPPKDAPKAPASPTVETPPPPADFLFLPLRLHVLTADDLPEADCKLTDADLARILKKVNGIWNKAGVHFGVESVVREPASGRDVFRLARDADGPTPLGAFRVLRPEGSRRFDGLHVYYVHELPVNGVFMGNDFAFVKETARLREVEGGIDEPIPRVTAHELGHALGLPHRQDRTNLLASGTTGTSLNAREVETARKRARRIAGSLTLDALRKAADDAESGGDRDRARRLWSWLAEVPGAKGEAQERLKALGAGSAKP